MDSRDDSPNAAHFQNAVILSISNFSGCGIPVAEEKRSSHLMCPLSVTSDSSR